jgi:hypothetical protein
MLVALWGCGLGNVLQGGRPLGGFPSPTPGEVDAVLPDAKAAFEADNAGVEVLRVESAQRSFDPILNQLQQPIGRMALVNYGFRVEGKCYLQVRRIGQSSGPTGYAGVKVEPQPWAEALYGKGGTSDPYKTERAGNLGSAWPVDCAQINAQGPVFRPCPNIAGRVLCEQ